MLVTAGVKSKGFDTLSARGMLVFSSSANICSGAPVNLAELPRDSKTLANRESDRKQRVCKQTSPLAVKAQKNEAVCGASCKTDVSWKSDFKSVMKDWKRHEH